MENLPASGGQTFPTYLIDQLDEFCSNVTNVTGERNSDTELQENGDSGSALCSNSPSTKAFTK